MRIKDDLIKSDPNQTPFGNQPKLETSSKIRMTQSRILAKAFDIHPKSEASKWEPKFIKGKLKQGR